MQRYVVLHHTGFGEPHFDLMLESSSGSLLMTWRAIDWPLAAGDELLRIGDHRREYLDYEGPVSNNRGEVKRVACGACDVSIAPDQLTIQLHEPESQLMLLRQIQADRWRVVEMSD
jgi:hypothetical protein